MIWMWIIASLILSLLPLINKKIDLSYYMWLLIPIDTYGISLAGAVIKPYMIFAVILLLVTYAKNKGTDFDLRASKEQLFAGVISILIIITGAFSGSFAILKASLLALIVYICAQMYVSSVDCSKSEQLSDVFIASCFGCTIVYIVAYICLQSGLDIGGIVTHERSQPGMFMQMSNMSSGKFILAYRLRGFAYDPNTMFPQLIFGISACVTRLFKKFNFYYIITIALSVFSIFLSSSRMGLICCAIAIVITTVVSINHLDNVKKKMSSFIIILILCSVALLFLMTNSGQSMITSLLSTYQNRSSLTDEYGRFSIWKECLNIYWNKNPILGVGLGQMDNLTATNRMTHNTWLQFICECGLIVGGIAVTYFFGVMIIGWARTKIKHLNDPQNSSYLCLIIGYTLTIVSLASADNITCSYLWFGALLVLKMAFYLKPESPKLDSSA